jgi:putative oxidoreductase
MYRAALFAARLSKLFGFPAEGPPLSGLIILAAIIEAVGSLLLLVGLFTRFAAFVMSGEMAFAYFMPHAPKSFYPAVNGGSLAVLLRVTIQAGASTLFSSKPTPSPHACELGFEGVVSKRSMHPTRRETGPLGANPSASIARNSLSIDGMVRRLKPSGVAQNDAQAGVPLGRRPWPSPTHVPSCLVRRCTRSCGPRPGTLAPWPCSARIRVMLSTMGWAGRLKGLSNNIVADVFLGRLIPT